MSLLIILFVAVVLILAIAVSGNNHGGGFEGLDYIEDDLEKYYNDIQVRKEERRDTLHELGKHEYMSSIFPFHKDKSDLTRAARHAYLTEATEYTRQNYEADQEIEDKYKMMSLLPGIPLKRLKEICAEVFTEVLQVELKKIYPDNESINLYVHFAGFNKMRELNKKYKDISRATAYLSLKPDEYPEEYRHSDSDIGRIIICPEAAVQKYPDVNSEEAVCNAFARAMLKLIDFDTKTPEGKKKQEELKAALLERIEEEE